MKFIGKHLSSDINLFILHLEEEDKKSQAAQSRKKDSGSSRKNEILKNTRSIPKLVYAMEQFSKCIMQLSNKTKIDLHRYIGAGTTRDFRILVNELDISEKDGTESQENNEDEDSKSNEVTNEDDDNQTENDEDGTNDDIEEEEDGNNSDEDSDDSEDRSTMPPSKKKKH